MKKLIIVMLLTLNVGLLGERSPLIIDTKVDIGIPTASAARAGKQISPEERKKAAQEELRLTVKDGFLDEQYLKQCLENGADINELNIWRHYKKLTLRDIAIIEGYDEVEALLARHGGKVTCDGLMSFWEDVDYGYEKMSEEDAARVKALEANPENRIHGYYPWKIVHREIDEISLAKVSKFVELLNPSELERAKLKKPVREKLRSSIAQCKRLAKLERKKAQDFGVWADLKRECDKEPLLEAYIAVLDTKPQWLPVTGVPLPYESNSQKTSLKAEK